MTEVRDRRKPQEPKLPLTDNDKSIIELAASNGHMSPRDQAAMRQLAKDGPREIREALGRTAEGHQAPGDAEKIRRFHSEQWPRPSNDD